MTIQPPWDGRRPKIGILAGMGPRSTAPFLDMVITQCQLQYGAQFDEEFPAILVYSLPTPFYVDRPLDHARMAAVIEAGLKTLADSGVELIAMPCVTAHAYWDRLTGSVRVPMLNMIDETVAAIGGNSSSAALLATRATMASGILQRALAARGIEVVTDKSWQDAIDELISGVKTGRDKLVMAQSFSALLDAAGSRVDTVVVACTDLSVLKAAASIRKVDAAEVLAAAVVREYLSQKKITAAGRP